MDQSDPEAARELGRCISPMRKDKVKVSFRLLSPNPSALDYRPGHTYYFITTSTGTPWGLDNTKGGLCSTHQLKMIIHVEEVGNTILSTVTRGERLSLDVGSERHEYESVPFDELDFQIHEIGDVESLFMSSPASPTSVMPVWLFLLTTVALLLI
ncbi:unnamed protein product [Strongylus vulgaris]|uniref:Ephrin RBD domain-containing protein n=1 Tax=Strongylus vulgaris TaxID=40348 RepID=A0A3P7LBR7_STRVU|nr:unnamed protein product [Strongylus vulgaris]